MADAGLEPLVRQMAWLLLGAALIGMLARWASVPYAVALVIGGLLIEESHLVAAPALDPGLLLFVFLPPLLFDAAFRLDAREVRALAQPILVLGVPGVLVIDLLIGLTVAPVLGGSIGLGLLFGSIVAATDPVAVTAVFHHLKAPGRLSAIAEGESLINDGVAITLYTALLHFALTGKVDPLKIGIFFLREVVGGVLIGVVAGFAFSRLTALIDDHLIEMMISTALAYGSFLLAQAVESSGALACVTAGFIHGSHGRRIGMSEETSRLLDDLWEYLGFLANAFLFLLVGLTMNLGVLIANAGPVILAIVAVVVTRALVVGLPPLAMPTRLVATTPAERVILVWGGLRGALTIALALALPAETPSRSLLAAMAFGTVLFTLVVQGLTLAPAMRRLGVAGPTEPEEAVSDSAEPAVP